MHLQQHRTVASLESASPLPTKYDGNNRSAAYMADIGPGRIGGAFAGATPERWNPLESFIGHIHETI
jgi:hypothetical protein